MPNTKPSEKPRWATGGGAAVSTPPVGDQDTGWTTNKPPHQWFNWLFKWLYNWLNWFEIEADFRAGYAATVGAATHCTHATLAAAIADAGVVAGSKILVEDDETVDAAIDVNKDKLEIEFKPGVTYTKGTANICLNVSGAYCTFKGGRFIGFTGGTDKVFTFSNLAVYCQVLFSRFGLSTNIEVDDASVPAGKEPAVVGTMTEV